MKQRIILGEFAGVELEANPERSYLRSAEELTSLEKEYLRQGDIEKAAQVAQALAECLRRVGDLQGAEDHSKRALLFYKETHNLGGVAWTEWHTGTALRQRGNYAKALKQLQLAYRRAIKASDIRCAVYSVAGIAETNRIQGHYAIALPQHFRALHIFNTMRDPRGVAWAYEGIGQMQKNQGQLLDALRSFEVARKIALESGDIRGLGWALKGVGEVRSLLGKSHEGIDDLLASLHIFQKSGAKVAQAYTQKVLGDSLLRSGKIDAAAARYIVAADIFSSTNDERGIGYVLVGLGDLHWKIGLRDEAVAVYRISSDIFKIHRLEYGMTLCAQRFERAGVTGVKPAFLSREVGGLIAEAFPKLSSVELVTDLQGIIERSLSLYRLPVD